MKKEEIKIRESERRRADNQIWNAAGAYDFRPDVRAYDREGCAELYWNSIIGAVRKHYGHELDGLWEEIRHAIAQDVCEQLLWLGLEHACYEREARLRPAFPVLRHAYALKMLALEDDPLPGVYGEVWRLHFERAARAAETEDAAGTSRGDDLREDRGYAAHDPAEHVDKFEETADSELLLRRLEFSGELSGREIAEQARELLDERTLLIPRNHEEYSERSFHIPFFRPKRKKKGAAQELDRVRGFAGGLAEYGDPILDGSVPTGKHQIFDMSEKKSDAHIYQYIHEAFGSDLFAKSEAERIERLLCTGDHENCHLHFVKGDGVMPKGIQGYAYNVRREAIRQMKQNLDCYEANEAMAQTAIRQLTERWRNAFLTYRQDSCTKSVYGKLAANRIWRTEQVNDDRAFDRKLPADDSDFYVDILLDASYSQKEKQPLISLQGYIIAESLTRCGIPVRVSAFSSVSGYTILTQYRDYHEPGKNRQIFNYTTAGGNRDGLAIRLMHLLMKEEREQPERRILLLLSDARPKDIIYINNGSSYVPYEGEASVENTAKEVRYLKNRGISVLCVFTGSDDDVPTAHQIYGRDFVRIRGYEHFAQAVGSLILTQIRADG